MDGPDVNSTRRCVRQANLGRLTTREALGREARPGRVDAPAVVSRRRATARLAGPARHGPRRRRHGRHHLGVSWHAVIAGALGSGRIPALDLYGGCRQPGRAGSPRSGVARVDRAGPPVRPRARLAVLPGPTVDGDGVPDLVATFAIYDDRRPGLLHPGSTAHLDIWQSAHPGRRVIAAVSGRSGRPLWSTPIDRKSTTILHREPIRQLGRLHPLLVRVREGRPSRSPTARGGSRSTGQPDGSGRAGRSTWGSSPTVRSSTPISTATARAGLAGSRHGVRPASLSQAAGREFSSTTGTRLWLKTGRDPLRLILTHP